ncbi:MAG TPA: hypothetical protein VJQ86_07430, partial [Rhodanobacteraceae bacterium]|nr:hypothetical protein [Rhodanobacteraceae bacterium]
MSFTAIVALAMIACASVAFPRTGDPHATTTDSATVTRREQRWLAAVSPGGDRGTLTRMRTDHQRRRRNGLLAEAGKRGVDEERHAFDTQVAGRAERAGVVGI